MNELPESPRSTRGGTDRSFGFVLAALFAIVGIVPLLRGELPRTWPLVVAMLLLGVSLVAPSLLAPLYRLWRRVGAILQKVMTPIIMGLLYFVVLCPIAVLARLLGRDVLRLKWQPQATTYWVERQPPGPDGASMKNQF